MKLSLLLIPLILFMTSCSQLDQTEIPQKTPKSTVDKINASGDLSPKMIQSLEDFAGKTLNKEGWVLLKDMFLFSSYTQNAVIYDIYSGMIEPKYCKPEQIDCIAKRFIIITENEIPIYYDETLDEKFKCMNMGSILPEEIAKLIITSHCIQ